MKKTTIWDKLWYGFVAAVILMFLIPFLVTIYWAIFGLPETPFPVYLNKDAGQESFSIPLSAGEVWEEDDFTLQLSDVQIGEVDENGMRLCEITVQIENENIVTYKSSRKLMGFVHYNRDSEDAYRGSMGTVEEWERENTIELEKHVKDIMEIWVDTGVWLTEHEYQALPRNELTEWYVPKGAEAIYRYQMMIPENALAVDVTFQILVDRKNNEQYWKEYRFNPADYIESDEVTA